MTVALLHDYDLNRQQTQAFWFVSAAEFLFKVIIKIAKVLYKCENSLYSANGVNFH